MKRCVIAVAVLLVSALCVWCGSFMAAPSLERVDSAHAEHRVGGQFDLPLVAPYITGLAPRVVLPCRIVSVHDGDTLTVDVMIRANVRLLDCWVPEVTGEQKANGQRSSDKLREMAHGKNGLLTVPLGDNLSESFTFGRVLGRVSVAGRDLSEAMVASGAATKERR